MKRFAFCLAALLVLALPAGAAQAYVDMETVPVGNPGNADDTHGDGYGGVDYEYRIGKYEVTAGQYRDFLNAVARTDTYWLYTTKMDSRDYGCQITRHGTSGNYTYDFSGRPSGTTEADWSNRPVNYVNWGDTARFANWLHNGQPTGAQGLSTTEDGAYYLNGATSKLDLLAVSREADWKWAIPTEDEWYKAAYHKNDGVTGNYFDYPTSSNAVPGRDLSDVSGNNANYYGNPWPIDSPYYTTIRGEFQDSESPYGTFDQGGNVSEWNEAILYDAYRGDLGGAFAYYNVVLHASYRHYDSLTLKDDSGGFRVANIPEPGSIPLLVCGVVGLLAYAWRRRRHR